MYNYLNLNPLNEHDIDCVCRAISLATEEDYSTIERQLYGTSLIYGCDELCVCCYHHLLEKFYGYKRVKGYKGCSIEEFLYYNPIGTYIIRVNQHLTTVIDGQLYDIWDCSQEIVDIVWQVQ